MAAEARPHINRIINGIHMFTQNRFMSHFPELKGNYNLNNHDVIILCMNVIGYEMIIPFVTYTISRRLFWPEGKISPGTGGYGMFCLVKSRLQKTAERYFFQQ